MCVFFCVCAYKILVGSLIIREVEITKPSNLIGKLSGVSKLALYVVDKSSADLGHFPTVMVFIISFTCTSCRGLLDQPGRPSH